MFLRIIRNWKTSIVGLGLILFCAYTAAENPSRMKDQDWQAGLVAAWGFLVAKDADKSHTQEPLVPPQD